MINKTNKIEKLTKIITSIGESTKTLQDYKELLLSGSDIARINFSHGSGNEHQSKIEMVNQASKDLNKPWTLLLDTKGPEIRTHLFKNGSIKIESNSIVEIYLEKEILGDETKFSISYPNLWQDVKVGGRILIDDGYLALEILDLNKEKITTKALNTRIISDRRGVNVPGANIRLEFLSKKDKEDIIWGCSQSFKFIALSFVQNKEDVLQVRQLLKENNREDIQIIAKLESTSAIYNFDEILHVSDGIMVARGDLGVESDPARVPVLQKKWIRECNKVGKPIIVATQMLESMISNPFPTRAEVSDVYNAVADATSAIMLSGETAKGIFFKESTQMMRHIAGVAEYNFDNARYFNRINRDGVTTKFNDIAKRIFRATNENEINHIFVLSNDKTLINTISRIKPQAKIHPIITNEKNIHNFALNYGVYTIYSSFEVDKTNKEFFKSALSHFSSYHSGIKILVVDEKNIERLIL